MGLESGYLFLGPSSQNFTRLYPGVGHTVVLIWSSVTLPGPVRLLAEFRSCGYRTEVPVVLMAVGQGLLSAPRASGSSHVSIYSMAAYVFKASWKLSAAGYYEGL